jgi:hypothetical protein
MATHSRQRLEFFGSGDCPNEARNLNQTKSMTEAVIDLNLKMQSPFVGLVFRAERW